MRPQIPALLLTGLILSSCGPGVDGNVTNSYQQVDRLGRPAINEALVISNANLNLWNESTPATDLTSPAYITEAGTVLTVINAYGTNVVHATPPSVATVVKGFIPDTQRIDTTTTVAVSGAGSTAYNSCLGATNAILCGGRKPTDDTIAITLSYLLAGDPTGAAVTNGVNYAAGHTALNTSSPSAFPYLAVPH